MVPAHQLRELPNSKSTQPRSETFWVTLYYHCQDLICVHAQRNLVQGSPSAWEGNMLTPKLMLHFAVSLSCDPGQQRNLEFDVNKFLSQSRWATLYINRMREASLNPETSGKANKALVMICVKTRREGKVT